MHKLSFRLETSFFYLQQVPQNDFCPASLLFLPSIFNIHLILAEEDSRRVEVYCNWLVDVCLSRFTLCTGCYSITNPSSYYSKNIDLAIKLKWVIYIHHTQRHTHTLFLALSRMALARQNYVLDQLGLPFLFLQNNFLFSFN